MSLEAQVPGSGSGRRSPAGRAGQSKEEIQRSTVQLLKTLASLTSTLGPAPPSRGVMMQLLYDEAATPLEYEPLGFVPARDSGECILGTADACDLQLAVGSVRTAHHALGLGMRTMTESFEAVRGVADMSQSQQHSPERADPAASGGVCATSSDHGVSSSAAVGSGAGRSRTKSAVVRRAVSAARKAASGDKRATFQVLIPAPEAAFETLLESAVENAAPVPAQKPLFPVSTLATQGKEQKGCSAVKEGLQTHGAPTRSEQDAAVASPKYDVETRQSLRAQASATRERGATPLAPAKGIAVPAIAGPAIAGPAIAAPAPVPAPVGDLVPVGVREAAAAQAAAEIYAETLAFVHGLASISVADLQGHFGYDTSVARAVLQRLEVDGFLTAASRKGGRRQVVKLPQAQQSAVSLFLLFLLSYFCR